jgi:hypothetical protein
MSDERRYEIVSVETETFDAAILLGKFAHPEDFEFPPEFGIREPKIHACHLSFERGQFQLLVSSPDFEPIRWGWIIPMHVNSIKSADLIPTNPVVRKVWDACRSQQVDEPQFDIPSYEVAKPRSWRDREPLL